MLHQGKMGATISKKVIGIDTSGLSPLRFDVYKQNQYLADTATRFGLFLTVLTPLCMAAYAAVLIAFFVTRPVVLTATSESTFFATPSVGLNCMCSGSLTCIASHSFSVDNDLSSFCASSLSSQVSVFVPGISPLRGRFFKN